MQMDYIIRQVERVTKKAGSRNPYEICEVLNYRIHYENLQNRLKGYFVRFSRINNIVIDENLDKRAIPILLAHELGHGILHQKIAMMTGFQELEMLDKRQTEPCEYEANLFAAELLLEDEKVLDLLNEYTFFETAAILNVPAALLDFKFKILQAKGYSISSLQYGKADFLKEDCGMYTNMD